MRLQNKIIAVTGGTKGIGAGIVRILAGEGAFVVFSGRSKTEGESLAAELKRKNQKAGFFQADISKVKDCFAFIEKAVESGGRIDGLVNNAGIFPTFSLPDTNEDLYNQVMSTNVKGPFFAIQRALKYMNEQKKGSIVNIGSTHWRVGPKDMSAYSISKGALRTLTEHVALHYIGNGVRCNWVTVGWVISDGEIEKFKKMGKDRAWIEGLAAEHIPSGIFQTPEDIAHACVFFLSDESSQVTGADITVTGGFHSP
ncbi:MAG: SDR family oxidoreductase [Treponema sp.]|jgi:NAD(P)-dependent dehydrogenase (short-subunit alcohol dehydrogenase family)|nr:SDR family oxidoreductase [Treponema sp.]